MSRSYKHTPRCGMQKDGWYKNHFNRILRRHSLDPDYQFQHNTYKKLDSAYMICDYESRFVSFEQYYRWEVERWHAWGHRREPYPDRDTCRKEYDKWYKRR